MSWRRVIGAILSSSILVGLWLFMAPLVVAKLPMICCERRRGIHHLPLVGLVYYGLVIPLVLVGLRLAWWEVLLGVGLLALGGNWLLPDPFTYLLSPRKRRAVKQAIAYQEASNGPPVSYGKVSVIGSEVGRTIVSVPVNSGCRPPARRFLAVVDDSASIEELDFEYMASRHGVRACW